MSDHPLPEPIFTNSKSNLPEITRTVEEAIDAVLALPDEKQFAPDLWAAQEALFRAWKSGDQEAILAASELLKASLRREKWLRNYAATAILA
jgi:hypothetical protein